MLQFNLLPDVKKEYIKAKRQKRLIISISSIVSITSLVILVILFSYVQVIQRKSIDDLAEDISSEVNKVKGTQGLDEILTIQNQLNSIPGLAEERPETSRIFNYLKTVTPKDVFISAIEVDVVNSTMEITGTSNSLALINTFADTLKFATYKTIDVGDEEGETLVDDGDKPFNNVITDLSRNKDESTYTIELEYDPIIFNNTKTVTLIVPKDTVTTRSVTGQPDLDKENNGALFNSPEDEGDNQ